MHSVPVGHSCSWEASFPQKPKWKLSHRNRVMHLWPAAKPASSVCQQQHSSQSHFLKNLQRPQNHQTFPSRLLPPSLPHPPPQVFKASAEQQNRSKSGNLRRTSPSQQRNAQGPSMRQTQLEHLLSGPLSSYQRPSRGQYCTSRSDSQPAVTVKSARQLIG